MGTTQNTNEAVNDNWTTDYSGNSDESSHPAYSIIAQYDAGRAAWIAIDRITREPAKLSATRVVKLVGGYYQGTLLAVTAAIEAEFGGSLV